MASNAGVVHRALLGEPLRSDDIGETLLPNRPALPVFCSDGANFIGGEGPDRRRTHSNQ
jgi:hypothetical protein